MFRRYILGPFVCLIFAAIWLFAAICERRKKDKLGDAYEGELEN